MDAKKEKMLETLAKLMTLAKDQAGKPEGIAALEMATKLMAKHSIQETEIDLEKGQGANTQTIFEDVDGWEGLCDQGGKRQWVASLAGCIAYIFNGRCWISPTNNTVHFLGTAGDLETMQYFMDVIFSHIERAARKECRKPEQWKDRNIFGQAAYEEVSNRLHDMKRALEKEIKTYSGGSELMIVKSALVEQTVDDLFASRGFGSAKSNWVKSSNSSLMAKGRIAGKTAPLHRAIK